MSERVPKCSCENRVLDTDIMDMYVSLKKTYVSTQEQASAFAKTLEQVSKSLRESEKDELHDEYIRLKKAYANAQELAAACAKELARVGLQLLEADELL